MFGCGLIYFGTTLKKDSCIATQSTSDLGAKIMLSVNTLKTLALRPIQVLAAQENFLWGKIFLLSSKRPFREVQSIAPPPKKIFLLWQRWIVGHKGFHQTRSTLPSCCYFSLLQKCDCHSRRREDSSKTVLSSQILVITNVNCRNVIGQEELIIHWNDLVQHQYCVDYKSQFLKLGSILFNISIVYIIINHNFLSWVYFIMF